MVLELLPSAKSYFPAFKKPLQIADWFFRKLFYYIIIYYEGSDDRPLGDPCLGVFGTKFRRVVFKCIDLKCYSAQTSILLRYYEAVRHRRKHGLPELYTVHGIPFSLFGSSETMFRWKIQIIHDSRIRNNNGIIHSKFWRDAKDKNL